MLQKIKPTVCALFAQLVSGMLWLRTPIDLRNNDGFVSCGKGMMKSLKQKSMENKSCRLFEALSSVSCEHQANHHLGKIELPFMLMNQPVPIPNSVVFIILFLLTIISSRAFQREWNESKPIPFLSVYFFNVFSNDSNKC